MEIFRESGFNYIFISILDKKILHDVYNNFLAMSIKQEKILHMYMGYNANDNNIDVGLKIY